MQIDLQVHIQEFLDKHKYHTCKKCNHTNVWVTSNRLRLHTNKGPFTQDNPCSKLGIEHSEHHILSLEEASVLGLDNYYTRWTTEKDDLFLMIRDGKTVEEMAKILKRTKSSVNTKIYQLELREFYVKIQNGEIKRGDYDDKESCQG